MIVLTGGAGFIGSCILAALNHAGHNDVLIVDALESGNKWKNLVGKKYLDIVGIEEFRYRMHAGADDEVVDAVIHMGACSATTESDADYLYDNNTRYSKEIAEYAFINNARFIYASSAATYGNGDEGYSDVTRDLYPMNMYGYSKHLFDEWIRDNGFDDRCVGLKFFNVYGPNEYHKGDMASMAFKSTRQILSAGKVKLFKSGRPGVGDGDQQRDFVYVKDVCSTVLTLLNDSTVNGILNVGSGDAYTWNQLAMAVFAAMGREPSIEYVDMPSHLVGQYQDYTKADMSTFMTKLPSVQLTSLNDGVLDYVQQYIMAKRSYL